MQIANWYFASPWYFLLLLLIPASLIWYLYRGKKVTSAFRFPNLPSVQGRTISLRERITWLPFVLRALGFTALVVALARPQSFSSGENVYTEGIDIALCLDISGSMLAEDFKPNRLDAAKKITQDFIDDRTGDRLGLVIFSRDAFTQCPLTVDYQVLKNLLREVKSGMLEDGTAIGNALANGVNRLKDSKAKSKVLILLTDGVNNAGEIDPLTALEIAKHYNIRIYTIGIGTIGQAPYPFQTPYGIQYQMAPVEIDEALLHQIANGTGAKYYRATGNQKLETIYKEIDKLEKTKVETTSYKSRKEMFYPWAATSAVLIMLELLLSQTYLRRLP
ncbi:MAG: VWA domain-containing protein [Ignavibacteriales bacterium]|nr:VWA domain-containing protein [Ignavibacteriales bacterium]